jgi:hypothetical protein
MEAAAQAAEEEEEEEASAKNLLRNERAAFPEIRERGRKSIIFRGAESGKRDETSFGKEKI